MDLMLLLDDSSRLMSPKKDETIVHGSHSISICLCTCTDHELACAASISIQSKSFFHILATTNRVSEAGNNPPRLTKVILMLSPNFSYRQNAEKLLYLSLLIQECVLCILVKS